MVQKRELLYARRR